MLPPQDTEISFIVRPMTAADKSQAIGLFAGRTLIEDYNTAQRFINDSGTQHSVVAVTPDNTMIGFALGQKHGKRIDLTLLHADDTQADADLCRTRLVTAFAEQCIARNKDTVGIIVRDNDEKTKKAFNLKAAQLAVSEIAPCGMKMDVYALPARTLAHA